MTNFGLTPQLNTYDRLKIYHNAQGFTSNLIFFIKIFGSLIYIYIYIAFSKFTSAAFFKLYVPTHLNAEFLILT